MGFLDDIGDGLKDLGKSLGGALETGKHIFLDVFGGPGNIVGVIASSTASAIVGPGYILPVYIGSSVATNALIRHREVRGSEYAFARQVYGDSLPPADSIVLTNLSGLNGRQFVVPSKTSFGQYVVNMGDGYDDPLNYTNGSYPMAGQVFIHELAHVWQIHHCPFVPAFTCGALMLQYRNSILGRDVYNQGIIGNGTYLGRDFNSYNFEEQATLVDTWYTKQSFALRAAANLDAVEQALRPYLDLNVRPGNPGRPYRFTTPAEVLATLTARPWRVRYADGTIRKVTFAANGTCSFERITDPPPSAPASRLGSAAILKPSGVASRVKVPIASSGVVASGPSSSVRNMISAPAAPGVEPPVTLGDLRQFTNTGRWTCQPGMVTVEWTFDSEQWPTPLKSTVDGTRLSPSGTFKADYFPTGSRKVA